MKIKPEDLAINIELVPVGFGSPKRVVRIEHTPSGVFARSGMQRSDHANREVAMKELEKRVKAHYKNPPKKQFTYAVGHYWERGGASIGTYSYGNDVFTGTMEDANNFLQYVKKESPDRDWKIFMLVEVPT